MLGRKRDGGDAVYERLHRRADSAGIGNVKAGVVAEVDAGENDIGLYGHEEVDRELHAVGRRTADAPCVHDRYGEGGAAHRELAENGELLRHAAALARRRGDPDAAELCRGFGQTDYAGGVDTVVICDEDIELVFHYINAP